VLKNDLFPFPPSSYDHIKELDYAVESVEKGVIAAIDYTSK